MLLRVKFSKPSFFSFSIVPYNNSNNNNFIMPSKEKEKSNWFEILFSFWLQGNSHLYTDLQLVSGINLKLLRFKYGC